MYSDSVLARHKLSKMQDRLESKILQLRGLATTGIDRVSVYDYLDYLEELHQDVGNVKEQLCE